VTASAPHRTYRQELFLRGGGYTGDTAADMGRLSP
jgi:hypothetical protein